MNRDMWYLRYCKCPQCSAKRAAKLRIRGPLAGGLYVCYRPATNELATASGMNPEQAYDNWVSYSGAPK